MPQDDLNISGLSQPGVNLGGLLTNASMSGQPGGPTMSGATAGSGGGMGMEGGMDLAELLKMLSEQGGEVDSRGGAPLGTLPYSIAQQQASGDMGFGNLAGGYYTAGQSGSGVTSGQQQAAGAGEGSADPLAIAQKILGLGAKAGGMFDRTAASQVGAGGTFQGTGGEAGDFSTAPLQGLGGGPMADPGLTDLGNIQWDRVVSDPTYAATIDWGQIGEGFGNTALPGLGGGAMPDMSGLADLEGNALGLAGTEGGGGGFGDMFGNVGFGNSLGALSSLLGAYGAGQNENWLGAAQGGTAAASQIASMAGMGGAAAGLGAIGGPLSLAQGIQSGNPMQLGSGALQTYNSLATLGQMFPELGINLPSLSSLGGQAFSAVAPETAAALGIGSGVGTVGLGAGITPAMVAATPELAALGAAGTAGGASAAGAGAGTAAAGAGAGAAGVVALPAAVLALGVMAALNNLVVAPEKKLAMNIKDTAQRRGELGENIRTIGNRINEQGTFDYANATPESLQQRWQAMQDAIAADVNVNWMMNNQGSVAPSKIPRLDPTRINQVNEGYHNRLIPEMAALQDAMAQAGVPLDQFFQPLGATDIMQLAARGTSAPNAIDVNSLTPEQLAGIGPGNMAQALHAIRTGGSLTGLNPIDPSVQQARLAQAQAAAAGGGGQEYAQYFLNPQQMASMAQAREQQKYYDSYGPDSGYQAPALSPQQMYQQMLNAYQMPQIPAGMWGPSPAAQPAMSAPIAAPGGAATPQQFSLPPALLQALMGMGGGQMGAAPAAPMMMGGRVPGFEARGEEDPLQALRFAQYGA